MVRDKTQGGEDKRIENSVNICGATPFVSQNHVLTFICDLGQGSQRLRVPHQSVSAIPTSLVISAGLCKWFPIPFNSPPFPICSQLLPLSGGSQYQGDEYFKVQVSSQVLASHLWPRVRLL